MGGFPSSRGEWVTLSRYFVECFEISFIARLGWHRFNAGSFAPGCGEIRSVRFTRYLLESLVEIRDQCKFDFEAKQSFFSECKHKIQAVFNRLEKS